MICGRFTKVKASLRKVERTSGISDFLNLIIPVRKGRGVSLHPLKRLKSVYLTYPTLLPVLHPRGPLCHRPHLIHLVRRTHREDGSDEKRETISQKPHHSKRSSTFPTQVFGGLRYLVVGLQALRGTLTQYYSPLVVGRLLLLHLLLLPI